MKTLLRLAFGLAFSRDPSQRWRQASVAVSALVAVLCAALSLAVTAAARDIEEKVSARVPILATDEGAAKLHLSLRGILVGDHQVTIHWLDPVPQHESDPKIVPPGLSALPGPGEAVVSPGLVARGLTAESFGAAPSSAGTGPYGAIGKDGVGTRDELRVYMRPATGRTLGDGGALLGIDRYPTPEDIAVRGVVWDTLNGSEMMLTSGEAQLIALMFLGIPGAVVLGLGVRAQSPLRAQRAEFLLRLGVTRVRVRGLLAVEGAALAALGALAGALLYGLVIGDVTTLPLTGTTFFPRALSLPWPTLGLIASMVAVLAGAISCAGRWTPSRRTSSARGARLRRLAPLSVGLVLLAINAAGFLTATSYVYVLGVLLLAIGLPLATPVVAAWAARRWRTSERPHLWLAAARVAHDPGHTSRVAALVSLAVFLGATSVAIYLGPLGGAQESASSANGPLAVYSADWRDPQPGDREDLQANLTDLGDAIALAATYSTDENDPRPTVHVTDCGQLESLETLLGAEPCDAAGDLDPQVVQLFGDALGVHVDRRAPTNEAIGQVVIVAPATLSGAELYRAGGMLPGFNPYDLAYSGSVYTTISGWIAGGWFFAICLVIIAILRELVEYALAVLRHDACLARTGIEPRESHLISRWTLLIPILATAPAAYLCGLAASFVGSGVEITAYTPTWITLYTAIALALTAGSILVGFACVRVARQRQWGQRSEKWPVQGMGARLPTKAAHSRPPQSPVTMDPQLHPAPPAPARDGHATRTAAGEPGPPAPKEQVLPGISQAHVPSRRGNSGK